MNKKIIIGAAAAVFLILIYFFFIAGASDDGSDIIATVKKGTFKVEIETTGELEAKNSVKIQAPAKVGDYRIDQLTILSIVNEGVVVKRGDWIATMDQTEFQGKIKDNAIELDKAQASFMQTQLDTTLEMRKSRDELVNLQYDVEEKEIVLQQSKFEPPATIKQNEINMAKAKRTLEQALENYKIKKRQNIEKMRTVNAELRKIQSQHEGMLALLPEFNILAPEPGMVIYRKGWDGKPIKAGSQVGTWSPVVATLPDLTVMLSKTYVNEVDVRRVQKGQKVEIGLDAYPDKKLVGTVVNVANVGEQRPNTDAKVFQVDIEISGTDTSLRPAMTTSNKINITTVDNALYIPLECLHTQADSITYVYKRNGIKTIKQEVIIGETNANDAIVLAGLTEADKLQLSLSGKPDDDDDVELLPQLNGKRNKKNKQGEETKPAQTSVVPAGSPVIK